MIDDVDPVHSKELAERRKPSRVTGRNDAGRVVVPGNDEEALRRSIGRRIREIRIDRKLNIRQLAGRAGVTPGMISQVEHGQAMPSVGTLVRVCEALAVGVAEIIGQAPPAGRVVRANQRVSYPYLGTHDELISADPTRSLQVFYTLIDPGAGSGAELIQHGADAELVLVLSGELEVQLELERIVLKRGDSVTFPGTIPHGLNNRSARPVEMICVITPETY